MGKKLQETYHKLGELLVRKNLATVDAVDEALAVQRSDLSRGRTALRLGEILVKRKVLDRKEIREILEEQKMGRGQKRILRIDLRDVDGIATLSLNGRLDASKLDSLKRVLEKLMNRGHCRILIDAGKLVHLDSYGISSLVHYIDEARARGGDLKFSGLNADTRLVFERLDLDNFVQTFTTEREAVKAFELPIDEYMSRGSLAEFLGSQKTRQFHLSYCVEARRITEAQRIYYPSKWHARSGGRKPCKRCRP